MFRWAIIGCAALGGAFALGIIGFLVSPSLRDRVLRPSLLGYDVEESALSCIDDSDTHPDLRIAGCTTLIELGRVHWRTFYVRARAYTEKGDYDRAIQDFNQAIQLKPDDAYALRGRCGARAAANKALEAALSDCNESLRIRPDEYVLDSRGFVYFRMGQYDKVIADYDAVLKSTPRDASSLYVRGLAKARKGDTAGGDADIAEANALDPKISEEYARFGVTP